jgi:hypothetical protein
VGIRVRAQNCSRCRDRREVIRLELVQVRGLFGSAAFPSSSIESLHLSGGLASGEACGRGRRDILADGKGWVSMRGVDSEGLGGRRRVVMLQEGEVLLDRL